MVGIEFSCFQHHVRKKTPKRVKKGSGNGAKMEPRPGKEGPEAILEAMKALAKKMLQNSQEGNSE